MGRKPIQDEYTYILTDPEAMKHGKQYVYGLLHRLRKTKRGECHYGACRDMGNPFCLKHRQMRLDQINKCQRSRRAKISK